MPIESRIPTEEINVKDLTLDIGAEQQESAVDVEKYLNPEIWKAIIKDLEDLSGKTPPVERHHSLSYDRVSEMLANIKVAFPKKFIEFNVGENEYKRIYGVIVDRREGTGKEPDDWQVARAAEVKLIFPDKPLNEYFREEDWAKFSNYLKDLANAKRWDRFLRVAFALKILGNEKLSLDFIDDNALEEIKNSVSSIKHAEKFTGNLMRLKLLFPGKADLLFDSGRRKATENQLLKLSDSGSDGQAFVRLASAAKIVTAPEAEITDRGIIIQTKPTKLKVPTSLMPNVKKF